MEILGLRADGATFPALLALCGTALPDGILMTAIVRDLSPLRSAEAGARRHLETLAHVMRKVSIGELASGLADEVNQPLTAILTHAGACRRMLTDEQIPPHALTGSIWQILRQGQHAAGLLQHLRIFAHPDDAGFEPGLLNAGVNNVLALLLREIVKIDAVVDLDLQPRLPALSMDGAAIRQVVLNLLRNALEAIAQVPDKRRRLRIGTRLDSELRVVTVTIADHGPGLPDGDSERLFEPYVSTKPHGLGLGLSISRHIVESHGGRLWATRNDNGGACFHFTLPLDRRDPT